MSTNLIKTEKDGIGFYTNSSTGESGMSISGLARFAGVTPQSVSQLLEMLEKTTEDHLKVDILKPFAGKSPFLSVTENLKVIRDEVCAAIIEYYAFDAKTPTDAARFAYRKFASQGLRNVIQKVTGYNEPVKPEVKHVPDSIAKYYIAEEYRPWEKKFPEEFFIQLYRLRGWDYSLRKENKPYVVGRYINNLVYARLPAGIMEALKEINPVSEKGYRPQRYHQLIAEGQGKDHLDKQIVTVVALMKAADSWEQFMEMINRATPVNDASEESAIAPIQ